MSRHLPIADHGGSIQKDGRRVMIHPADVDGRFFRARWGVFIVLLGVYLAVPWITIGGHPAVLLDIVGRRFFLFGHVFNSQDAFLAFFLLTGIGFGLIAMTAVAGRLWCGWACPQTVFMEGVFRPLQRIIEGPAAHRIKREAKGWDAERVARRALLWSIYLVLAAAFSHVFLGYFTPVRGLLAMIRQGPSASPEAFAWTTAMTAVTFFNFAWFREQVCVAICPYGRLQSVLTDPDSLVIGYDRPRGEPRAKGKEKAAGAGDCVDCDRCVAVCPTGIDIRNGLQLDCVACSRCIDACDDVMDRLGRPRGLVRYDSQHGLEHKPRRVLRPRLALYAVLGTAGLIAATVAFQSHKPFEANLLRIAGMPYVVERGEVRNAFNIHVINKQSRRITFAIEPVTGAPFTFVIPTREVALDPLAGTQIPVFAVVPANDFHGDTRVELRVRAVGDDTIPPRRIDAPFLGPAR